MNEQDEYREQLSGYLDGELADEEARRVEEALSRDPGLAAELAQIRATRDLLRGLPREPAPEGFAGRVIGRAERRRLLGAPAREPYRSARWITIAAAAVVLLVAGIGVFFLVTPQPPPEIPMGAAEPEGPGDRVAIAEAAKEGGKAGEATFRKGPGPDKYRNGGPAGKGGAKKHGKNGRKTGPDDVPGKHTPPVSSADGVAYTETFSINTDDLAATQKEVELLLRAIGLPAELRAQPGADGLQVHYVIIEAPPEQLAKVRDGLKGVRARQRVPQERVELEEVVQLAALDGRSGRGRRAVGKYARSAREAPAPKLGPAKKPSAPDPAVPKAPPPPARPATPPAPKPACRPPGKPADAPDSPGTAGKKAPPKVEPPGEKIARADTDRPKDSEGDLTAATRRKTKAPKRSPAPPRPTVLPAPPEPTRPPAKKLVTDAKEPEAPGVKPKQPEAPKTQKGDRGQEGPRAGPEEAPGPTDTPPRRQPPASRAVAKPAAPVEARPKPVVTGPPVAGEAPGRLSKKVRPEAAPATVPAKAEAKDKTGPLPRGPATRTRARTPAETETTDDEHRSRKPRRKAMLITLNRLPVDVAAARAALLEEAKAKRAASPPKEGAAQKDTSTHK